MPTDRTWKTESVLMLGASVLFVIAMGMFTSLALQNFAQHFSVTEQQFYNFLASTLFFHVVTLIPVHFFLKQHEVSWTEFLGMKNSKVGVFILIGLILGALIIPIVGLVKLSIEELLTLFHVTPEIQPTVKILQVSISVPQRIWFGVSAIVFAPIAEEILFRGILFRSFQQRGRPMLGLVVSSMVFGAIHSNLVAFLPLTLFAVLLAMLYESTDTLLAPIVAHSLFNAIAFLGIIINQS